jgi:hypothetical protein
MKLSKLKKSLAPKEEGRRDGGTSRMSIRRARYERVGEDIGDNDEAGNRDHQNGKGNDEGGDASGEKEKNSRRSSLWGRMCDDWKECGTAIKNFPQDIYWIFSLKFLESYSYFALSQILVIYLHTEFHVSDIEAGMVYGMW